MWIGQLLLAKLGARLVLEVRECLLGYIGQMSFRDFERFGSVIRERGISVQ